MRRSRHSSNEISMSNYCAGIHIHSEWRSAGYAHDNKECVSCSFHSLVIYGRWSPGGLHSVALENYEKTREPIRLDVVNTFSVPLLLLCSQNFSCCYKAAAYNIELDLNISI